MVKVIGGSEASEFGLSWRETDITAESLNKRWEDASKKVDGIIGEIKTRHDESHVDATVDKRHGVNYRVLIGRLETQIGILERTMAAARELLKTPQPSLCCCPVENWVIPLEVGSYAVQATGLALLFYDYRTEGAVISGVSQVSHFAAHRLEGVARAHREAQQMLRLILGRSSKIVTAKTLRDFTNRIHELDSIVGGSRGRDGKATGADDDPVERKAEELCATTQRVLESNLRKQLLDQVANRLRTSRLASSPQLRRVTNSYYALSSATSGTGIRSEEKGRSPIPRLSRGGDNPAVVVDRPASPVARDRDTAAVAPKLAGPFEGRVSYDEDDLV